MFFIAESKLGNGAPARPNLGRHSLADRRGRQIYGLALFPIEQLSLPVPAFFSLFGQTGNSATKELRDSPFSVEQGAYSRSFRIFSLYFPRVQAISTGDWFAQHCKHHQSFFTTTQFHPASESPRVIRRLA
jgi:hypothetical protein